MWSTDFSSKDVVGGVPFLKQQGETKIKAQSTGEYANPVRNGFCT